MYQIQNDDCVGALIGFAVFLVINFFLSCKEVKDEVS